MSHWLYQINSGKLTLVALVIFFLFIGIVLPNQAEQASQYSSGAGSPDMHFFYTPEQLNQMAEEYGEAGRQAYVVQRFTFDIIWPVVYLFFMVTSITWVYAQLLHPGSTLRLVNLIPLVGFGFDLLENLATSIVMLRYPDPATIAAWLAPIFTMLKWLFIGIGFLLLILGGLMLGVRKITRSRQQGESA